MLTETVTVRTYKKQQKSKEVTLLSFVSFCAVFSVLCQDQSVYKLHFIIFITLLQINVKEENKDLRACGSPCLSHIRKTSSDK